MCRNTVGGDVGKRKAVCWLHVMYVLGRLQIMADYAAQLGKSLWKPWRLHVPKAGWMWAAVQARVCHSPTYAQST